MVESRKQDGRRFVLCLATILFGIVFAGKIYAQETFQVTNTREDKALKAFLVEGETVAMKVNVLNYNRVSEKPSDFAICYLKGQESYDDFLTVAEKTNIVRSVQQVDSVGRNDQGRPLVFFADGTKFAALDSVFFALQPGQKLEFTEIEGMTQNFFRVRTVPRDTPVSKKYGLLPAEEPKAEPETAEAAVPKSESEEDTGC